MFALKIKFEIFFFSEFSAKYNANALANSKLEH